MKDIRIILTYAVLGIGSVIFLFPLLWMVVTSFKVTGTGDKFIYIPEQKISFRYAGLDIFEQSNISLKEAQFQKLENLRSHLYSSSQIPQDSQMLEIIEQVLERRLNAEERQILLSKLSAKYDLNKLDVSQLKKILNISHEQAEIIYGHRMVNGSYDSPLDLGSIPLFSQDEYELILGYFKRDPTCLMRLDEQPYRRALKLTEERAEAYLKYRDRNGFSAQDLSELGRIPRFQSMQVESWKPYLFSNTLYTTTNYQKIFSSSPRGDDFTLIRALFNSLLVATGTGFMTLVLCLLGGYVFAKKDFVGKKIIYSILWASMLIPGMMFLVPQYAIVTMLDGINSYWAMIIPHCANIFGLYLVKQYIEQIPHSLFEAAIIDGASELQIFRTLIIPLTLPILSTLFLMTFLGQWSNFLWQLISNTPDSFRMTLPVTLAYFKGQYASDWTVLMAGASVMLLPIIVLFLLAQRTLIRGMTEGAVKE